MSPWRSSALLLGLPRACEWRPPQRASKPQAQLDKVRALGCTEMQGYLFSRPRELADLWQLFPPTTQRALAS